MSKDTKSDKPIAIFLLHAEAQQQSQRGMSKKFCTFYGQKLTCMKPLFLLLCLLTTTIVLHAQSIPYNVVFDLTSKDTNDHKMVVRWLSEISKERPDAKLEVVLYGQSLDMVQKNKSTVATPLQQLVQNKNISVKVCAAAKKRHNVDAAQLLPGVTIVPDGIYEIIARQKEGWGYIKATH